MFWRNNFNSRSIYKLFLTASRSVHLWTEFALLLTSETSEKRWYVDYCVEKIFMDWYSPSHKTNKSKWKKNKINLWQVPFLLKHTVLPSVWLLNYLILISNLSWPTYSDSRLCLCRLTLEIVQTSVVYFFSVILTHFLTLCSWRSYNR